MRKLGSTVNSLRMKMPPAETHTKKALQVFNIFMNLLKPFLKRCCYVLVKSLNAPDICHNMVYLMLPRNDNVVSILLPLRINSNCSILPPFQTGTSVLPENYKKIACNYLLNKGKKKHTHISIKNLRKHCLWLIEIVLRQN